MGINDPISIEKFAAFLDGNLSHDEMQAVARLVESDNMLQGVLGVNGDIEAALASYGDDIFLPEEIQNMDFQLPQIGNENNFSELQYDDLHDLKIYGEEGCLDPNPNPQIMQYYPDTCVIKCQQIVLRDYGIDIPQDELIEISMQNGWYVPGKGTPKHCVGDLLKLVGVDCHHSDSNTIFDVTNELAQGHRIIVAVDSGELWSKDLSSLAIEKMEDKLGVMGADHALIVAGVEVNRNNPHDVKVVLTDPGTGHLRKEYDMDEFIEAWKDSNCFMVSTMKPAPFQYDSVSNAEIPSGFLTDFQRNSFVIDHGFELADINSIVPDDYIAYYSDNNKIDFDSYLAEDSLNFE